MSILDPVINYCERTNAVLWAEPLNALSNASFFIAAWALYRLYQRKGHNGRPFAILIFLITLVGLGSTLFHIFANKLTMIGDVVPIALFTFYYLWVALRKLIGLRSLITCACLIAFAAIAAQMPHIPEPYRFNGSVAYFPCLAALLIMGIYLRKRRHPASLVILKATGWFLLSLTFRSLDMALCDSISIGTHFLWHSINGYVLYLLTKAIIRVE